MTDNMIQAKLDQLTDLCNELDDEAKRRYGKSGHLFFESDGAFHLMSGDADPDRCTARKRQSYIKFSSNGYCCLGGGAW